MLLDTWARRWNIPVEALADLKKTMGVPSYDIPRTVDASGEAEIQPNVRLQAAERGWRLWRNNVGAGYMMGDRSFVRFGLCNDSKALNDQIKSSDLIGIKPVVITPEDVGKTLGVFLSREVKSATWKFNPRCPRSVAQLAWINLINSLGGDAAFTTGEL